MNEAPFPTQAAVSRSLAPPTPRQAPAPRVSRLRASLVACTNEGLVAEAVSACFGNAVLTAWAIELGSDPLLLGALWGLPYFGQLFQLPGAWITARLGRKRAAVLLTGVARQVLLPVAALPFLDLALSAKRAAVVALFAASSILSTLGNNAWLAWVSELVPSPLRGRYFGRRAALCMVASTFAGLGVAAALDAGRAHRLLGIVLAACVVVRSALGALTVVLMARQHDPPGATASPALRDVTLPLRDEAYQRLLTYRAAWGLATGLAASVSAAFIVQALGLGFTGLAGYGMLVAVLRVVTSPLWGRALDRAGARYVLIACSFGAAASSFLWVGAASGWTWAIALDAIVSGTLLGGQELAVFTLPLAAAPRARRPLFVAVNMAVGGVAYGVACAGGGALAASTSARAVLTLSAIARLLAATTAIGLRERRSGAAQEGSRGPIRAHS
jgi:hypothetical protein